VNLEKLRAAVEIIKKDLMVSSDKPAPPLNERGMRHNIDEVEDIEDDAGASAMIDILCHSFEDEAELRH